MKIGLVRHYRVKKAYPRNFWVSYAQLSQWLHEYDHADVEPPAIRPSAEGWDHCYCSPASRALTTAKDIFAGQFQIRDELNELNVMPLLNPKLRLPLLVWALIMRSKAFSSHLIVQNFKNNLKAFVDHLLSHHTDDVLVVSHGFVMMHLQKELKDRGFTGDSFRNPANGKMYVFIN
ncbi:MAG: histidine phosphatase family protein [Spirosomataceae bacterium]